MIIDRDLLYILRLHHPCAWRWSGDGDRATISLDGVEAVLGYRESASTCRVSLVIEHAPAENPCIVLAIVASAAEAVACHLLAWPEMELVVEHQALRELVGGDQR